MTRIRSVTIVVAVIAVLIAGCLPASASTLTGIAHDLVGHSLADAEIFVASESAGPTAVSTHTDARGRFSVADLPPRLYRVAGFKDGYCVALGRVNTVLTSSVELLFRPLPRPGEQGSEAIPADRAWALRLPHRSILRDEEEGDELHARQSGTSHARLPEFLATLDGRLDQSFGTDRESGMQGSETRLRLSTPLGERGGVDLVGGRAWTGAADAVHARGLASSDLLVRVTFDPGADSRLSVQSFFADRDRAVARAPSARSPAGADRSWGWDARWSARLDASTHLDVGIDYRDASSSLQPGVTVPAADTRALQASGSFESIAARSHRLQLAFAAGQAVPSPAIESGGFQALDGGGLAAPGWSVRLNAQDSWSLSGRTSLVYGIGCLGPLDESGAAPVLIPRFGGVVTRERITARLVLSYLAGTTPDAPSAPKPMGYDAEVQLPLPSGFLLRGSASYAPALPDPDRATDASSRGPIYLTDGNAAVREASFGIERTTPFGSAFARYARGTADGSLSVLPVARAPLHVLGDEQIAFHLAHGGLRFARTGTRVEASWRSVLEGDARPTAGELARRSFETSVVQDLPHARERDLAWRLLLLYRTDRAAGADRDALADLIDEADLGREIRAGVSMSF